MPRYQGYAADYLRKPYDESPLLVFLDGTFHPDWRLDDPSVESALGNFVRSVGPSGAGALVADIESVVDQLRDPKLKELVARHLEDLSDSDRLGMDVGPWLLWLRRRLLDPAEEEQRFQLTKARIMASSVQSRGDDFLGMQIDFDAYLEMTDVLDDVVVRPTGDVVSLLQVTARGRAGVPIGRIAAELEWVWLSELRYRYLEAHTIRSAESTVTLDFVTQIGSPGFYVTGAFEVHASP